MIRFTALAAFLAAGVLALGAGEPGPGANPADTAPAQAMEPAPDAVASGGADSLHVRMEALEAALLARHMNEDLVLPCVIFPPAGLDAPVIGNHEDVAGCTAVYLAACAHRYAVTKDPAVRTRADAVMAAILRLEEVTGEAGWAARSFYKTDQPLWHEKAFFFPEEWHDSEAMPGYRWLGDLSSDKFVDFIYGVGVYWEFCADDVQKKAAADFIDRFVSRCIDHNFRLVDVDGKMTLWGNFCPDLPHESLNALEILAGLKVAHKLTGRPAFEAAYHRLLTKYHYDDQALLAKVLWPEEWKTPWDDHLAAKSFYMLMRFEEDPALLRKYRMSLNRFWHDWKNITVYKYSAEYWYPMLYQVITGEAVMDDARREALRGMTGLERARRTYTLPGPDGPRGVEAEQEEADTDVLRTYWFGRQYGFIDPTW